MKYTTEININKPIHEVIALFDNVDNLYNWMDGLQSFEGISGTPGEQGAKSKLKFKMGKREMEMVETILVKNLPEQFKVAFEMNGGYNTVSQRFEKVSDSVTRNIVESEFNFKGIMKYLAPLLKFMFKAQSLKYQVAFKKFVEAQ